MLGRVLDPHTLQFMFQVCKCMAPVANILCMPSTFVPTSQKLGVTTVTNKTSVASETKFLRSPQF